MSITANSLKINSAKRINFEVIIKDLLRSIDATLSRASSTWGATSSVTQIPKTFVEARDVDPDIARAIIYSAVIDDLERRGFTVTIRLSDEEQFASIKTSWESPISPQKIEQMEEYVNKHTIHSSSTKRVRSGTISRTPSMIENSDFLNKPFEIVRK